ncbi:hypothetical protein NHH03_10795 [Stieleria sp. TO1_6]|uniref:hypothetical protein n=1 Tax=Stieleria tagensis TaxID=2956795 RepID=UPI00209B209F|nr:hypothetical protein [Stieleria tagensis]MCO8122227.1 hypothetical protein [Stieleria tagensis]
MNPYKPSNQNLDTATDAPVVIARGGIVSLFCLAIGSFGLPIGLVVVLTFGWSNYQVTYRGFAFPLGICLLLGSVGFLLIGFLRIRAKSRRRALAMAHRFEE